jgi:hypothetical protein
VKHIGWIIIKYDLFVCAMCRDVEEAKIVIGEHFLSDGQQARPEKFEFFEVVDEADSDSYIHDYPVKSLGFLLDEEALRPGNIMVKNDGEVCGTYETLEQAKKEISEGYWCQKFPDEAQHYEFFEVLGKAGTHLTSLTGPGWHDENGNRVINGYAVKELGYLLA